MASTEDLYEQLIGDFILDDGVDCSECSCGAWTEYSDELGPYFSYGVKITQDMIDNRDDLAQHIWKVISRAESSTTWGEVETGEFFAVGWSGLTPGEYEQATTPGCKCLYVWAEGIKLFGKDYYVMWNEFGLSGCPAAPLEDMDTVFEYEQSFNSWIQNTEDSYGFASSWSPTWEEIAAGTWRHLDEGEVGIVKYYETSWLYTDEDEDGVYDTATQQEAYIDYAAVFDHDEPKFNNFEAVDATNYRSEPVLDEKELASLDDLYGDSGGDMASLLASHVESIADTIATAAGETGQPLNKIKYVQIDEDVFDAIGAEEGKEAMAVSVARESTVTYGGAGEET